MKEEEVIKILSKPHDAGHYQTYKKIYNQYFPNNEHGKFTCGCQSYTLYKILTTHLNKLKQ